MFKLWRRLRPGLWAHSNPKGGASPGTDNYNHQGARLRPTSTRQAGFRPGSANLLSQGTAPQSADYSGPKPFACPSACSRIALIPRQHPQIAAHGFPLRAFPRLESAGLPRQTSCLDILPWSTHRVIPPHKACLVARQNNARPKTVKGKEKEPHSDGLLSGRLPRTGSCKVGSSI